MNDLISVTEYAQLYHKDPGNIRRHLASGRLSGYKIGNQWVLPRDSQYPGDGREKSGEYRNWRKKVKLNSNKELMKTVSDLSKELRSIYGDSLDRIMLYGSYARGTQTDESDVDIAVMLNKEPSRKMIDLMTECVVKRELECNKVLSVIDIQTSNYNSWKTRLPFYRNIEKEGITLWKAR